MTMTATEIINANIKDIYKAGDFLIGKALPEIINAASDKQETFAKTRRYEALKLVCVLPSTVRAGIAADASIDTARAEAALLTVVTAWTQPRAARVWIDNSPSLASLCGEVMAEYQK